MKKYFFPILIFTTLFALMSCKNENAKSEKTTNINFVQSVLFYDEGSLWSENNNGELVWFTTLTRGAVLNAFPTNQDSTSTVTESKLMAKVDQTEKDDYTKVLFNDNEYWVLSALIIPNSTPKLSVSGKNYIYTSTDSVSITNTTIPENSIVAFIEESKDEFGTSFSKISYRASNKVFRDVYVKSEALSSNQDDVTTLRILTKYKKCSNLAVKKDLFENLKALTPSSSFNSQINAIEEELYPPQVEVSIESTSVDYTDTVDSEYSEEVDDSYDYSNYDYEESDDESSTDTEAETSEESTDSNSDYYEFF